MNWKIADHRLCFNLIGVIILLGGLGSALMIYRFAENNLTNVLCYEEGGGSVYPVNLEDSKKYIRDLELYGGKANVLATEFRLWLVGLWQGESLAFTIAFITVLISSGFFYAAKYRHPIYLKVSAVKTIKTDPTKK
jgi:hypothetical protein